MQDTSRASQRVSGALLGTLAGLALGGWIGYEAASGKPDDQKEFAGIAEGLLGSAIGGPIGAHLFDAGGGSLVPSLVLSGGLALAGYAADSGWLLWTAPVYSVVISSVVR